MALQLLQLVMGVWDPEAAALPVLAPVLCLSHLSHPSADPQPRDPCSLGVRLHLPQDVSSPSGALPTGAWTPASFLRAAAPVMGHRSCRSSWCRALLGEIWALRELSSYHSQEQHVSVMIQTEGAVCPSQLAAHHTPRI